MNTKQQHFDEITAIKGIKIGYFNGQKDKLIVLNIANKLIDSIGCTPNESSSNKPKIIISDINNDEQYDVLIVADYSDANELLTYKAFLSDTQGVLTKPIVKVNNKSFDFFGNDDLVNYNMRKAKQDIFMFQHKYNYATFYELKDNIEFIPVSIIYRDSTDFSKISYWDKSHNSWQEPKAITYKQDSVWYDLAKEHWGKPFIGGCLD